jgi:hypothetical protein
MLPPIPIAATLCFGAKRTFSQFAVETHDTYAVVGISSAARTPPGGASLKAILPP